MFINYRHPSVRLTGRWDKSDPNKCITTAPGSYFEFAFSGELATMRFDIEDCIHPYGHLWIQLDGGALTESPIDGYIRVKAQNDGEHICRVIYKSNIEAHSRWFMPLHGYLAFCGYTAEESAALPSDNRKIIEFVGDSITEGVLVTADCFKQAAGLPCNDVDMLNRNYQDDVCSTYAWLTAAALNLRPVFQAYGAVGVTRPGQGRVPAAPDIYPFNFDGSKADYGEPDYILINHGANDRINSAALFVSGYTRLLDTIRCLCPAAKIISLQSFCGGHNETHKEMISEYNKKTRAGIVYIDTSGWVPPEPLHPLTGGHRIIAGKLIPVLKELITTDRS